jgi:YD repeat-containing protein
MRPERGKGHVTETINGANLPSGRVEITTSMFDQFGDVTETLDGSGRPTYFGLDLDGEVTVTISDVPAGSPTTLAGLLTGVGLWNVTDDLYDGSGNVTETIEGANLATSVQVDTFDYYDEFGNVTETVDSLGDKTTNVYDKDNELVQVDDPTSGVVSYGYDVDGNQTLVVDADGNRTTFTFDAMGQKTEEQDPTGDVITYQYDEFGELTSMVDSLGNQINYTYDDDGRETGEIWRASGTITNVKCAGPNCGRICCRIKAV